MSHEEAEGLYREAAGAGASPGPPGPLAAGDGPLARRLAALARHLDRIQAIAVWVAGLSLLLGFLASIDVLLLPRGEPRHAWAAHLLLLAVGLFGGAAASLRGRLADRRRWEILEEPLLTSMERENAHREAERERRVAATVFMMAPIFLGYWLAYQLAGEDEGTLVTFLLTLSPLVGYVLGLLFAHRALGPEERP